jgi:T-complex protein 1 subunit delta
LIHPGPYILEAPQRDETDFLTKSLGCKPVADIEAFTEDKLGCAGLVEEINNDGATVWSRNGASMEEKR